MKRVFIIIILPIHILISQTTTEWISLYSNITDDFSFVHFPTQNVGYVVGKDGTILKTTNAGSTWISLNSGTTFHLSGVYFTSELVGYVSGDYNTLLKTTNGGNSWFLLSTSANNMIAAVFFVSDNIGYITSQEKIWRTTNAGEGWDLIYDSGFGSFFASLYFLDNNLGFACGSNGEFLKTTNGGNNWTLSTINPNTSLRKVQFLNNNIGYIVAMQYVFKTTNGGTNWSQIQPYAHDWRALFFTSLERGFIAGDYQGHVYSTTNGGVTWNGENTPALSYVYSMFFVDENTGYAVGNDGLIMKYIHKEVTLSVPNGGENWQVGSTYNIEWSGINVENIDIEYTTNNGSSWINIVTQYPQNNGFFPWQIPNTPSNNYCKVKIKESDNSTVYDISDGTFTISAVIEVTTPNGGELWHVGSSKNITWNSQNITNVKIDYSTNNGSTWNLINASVPAANGIYLWTVTNTVSDDCKVRVSDANNLTNFDLSDNVFSIIPYPSITVEYPNGGQILEGTITTNIQFSSSAVDSVMIHYSTNGGTNWIISISSTPATGGAGWVVPNITSQNCLIKVTDTEDINNYDISDNMFEILSVWWARQTSNVDKNLNSINMLNTTIGYSCGDEGTIVKTTNSGENWESLSTGIVEDLNSIDFVSENTGWVVGENGLILRTTNGGLSWSYQNSTTNSLLNSIYFINQNVGWIAGSNGLILKTSDMGNTWIPQQSNVSVSLNSIFFNSLDLGWIVGNSGTYLKTTNGGETWTQKTVGISEDLNSILFNDDMDGFTIGDGGTILLCEDGGDVWTNVSIYDIDLFSIYFANNETGFVVGRNGRIYKTTDMGFNWFRIGSGVAHLNYDLFDVVFINLSTGWAVGEDGTILKTTNGGVSFVKEEDVDEIPTEFLLSQNWPNPFNSSSVIRYSIPQTSSVVIKVFDLLGTEIETLVSEEKDIGTYEITWYTKNLPSGVYFYRIQAGDFVQVKKMILLR